MQAWLVVALLAGAPGDTPSSQESFSALHIPFLLIPFVGPYNVLESRRPQGQQEYLGAYPYADGQPGVFRVDKFHRTQARRRYAGQVSVDSTAFRGLTEGRARHRVDVRVQGPARFEFRGDTARYIERTKGKSRRGALETNATGVLRFAQNQRVHFLTGLGFSHRRDKGVEQGVHLLYGVQSFPVRPLTFEARVRTGAIDGRWMLDTRVRAGIALRRFELFAGYESQNWAGVTEHGPQLGLRLWL